MSIEHTLGHAQTRARAHTHTHTTRTHVEHAYTFPCTNARHMQAQANHSHMCAFRSELRAIFVKKDGAYVADQAVEEMLADLDEDESDTIDPAEFWREMEGAADMQLS
jgi:hypothetical protein